MGGAGGGEWVVPSEHVWTGPSVVRWGHSIPVDRQNETYTTDNITFPHSFADSNN